MLNMPKSASAPALVCESSTGRSIPYALGLELRPVRVGSALFYTLTSRHPMLRGAVSVISQKWLCVLFYEILRIYSLRASCAERSIMVLFCPYVAPRKLKNYFGVTVNPAFDLAL